MAKKVAKKEAVISKKGKKSQTVDAPEKVKAKVMSPAETTVMEARDELAIMDFPNPMELSIPKLEKEAVKLYKNRVSDEFKLSFTLYALVEKNAPADRGYEAKDYFTKFLNLSYTKANEMIANARFLIDVGVSNLKRLVGLSWPKVKLLRKPVQIGAISKKNVESWLDKCKAGPDGTAEWTLERQIKDLLASKAKVELDESLVSISFKIPAYAREIVNRFEEIAEKVFAGDRGNWYIQALSETAAAHVNKVDADLIQAKGLSALKEMAEQIAPVAAIYIPLAEGLEENAKLGLTTKIYQGYSPDTEGVKELKYCFAGSEAEAKKHLGVKEVRAFPIEVSGSMRPSKPVKTATSMEEAAPEEPAPKADELSEEEMKEAIKNLVAKNKISKEIYQKKKAALVKKHDKGPALTKAVYEWLKAI